MKGKDIALIVIAAYILVIIFVVLAALMIKSYFKILISPNDIAGKTPDKVVAFCEGKSVMEKDICLFQAGILTFKNPEYKDGLICLKISNLQQKNTCVNMFASKWKNPDLCDNIFSSDLRIICQASASRDSSLCSLISNGERRNACAEQVRLAVKSFGN